MSSATGAVESADDVLFPLLLLTEMPTKEVRSCIPNCSPEKVKAHVGLHLFRYTVVGPKDGPVLGTHCLVLVSYDVFPYIWYMQGSKAEARAECHDNCESDGNKIIYSVRNQRC